MRACKFRCWSVTLSALVLFLVTGCDIPTQAPSIHTETNVDAPIVAEKTFSFLGGPASKNEPLIDTTSSTYDSLFVVADDPADISLEQRIDNFDMGSLDGVLNEAGGALSVTNSSFSQVLLVAPQDGNLPDEIVYKRGTLQFEQNDRVAFGNADNYVQAVNATVEMGSAKIKPDPTVVDTLEYTYPDVRTKPYELRDTLVVRFLDGTNVCDANPCPDGTYEYPRSDLDNGFNLTLDTIQVYPDKNTLQDQGSMDFGIRAWLNNNHTVSKGDTISVSGAMSVQDFELHELSASAAKPFTVKVTEDANGDGNLDVASDSEALTAPFEGFKGFTNRVDGLQLASANLDFSFVTKNVASTDAQIYTAMQGTNDSQKLFLAGEQDENQTRGEDLNVSSLPSSSSTGFVESGRSISLDSLTRFPVDLEDASLGTVATRTVPMDGENSNVVEFINALPTAVRLASQVEMNRDAGDVQIRQPVQLDAGLTLSVPLQIKGELVFRDTMSADFSSFNSLADPNKSISVSAAEFRVRYENALPLGADIRMTIVNQTGTAIKTYTPDDGLRLDPPPKNQAGAVEAPTSGTLTLPLANSQEEFQRLIEGRSIQLEITMTQNAGEPARLRADDTLRLALSTDVEASVDTNN